MSELEAQLRAESQQIERLLEELREMTDPAAWQRIEQLLRLTVGLYGAGLARALDHARAAGAELDDRIANDELLASLLLLHGLHPLSTEQRVANAIATLRAELGLAEHELVSLGLAHGTLRLEVGPTGGAMSPRVTESVIRRALEAAAPELVAIELLGMPVPRDPTLVQLRVRREVS